MKYTLFKEGLGNFETDYWVMADRKIAQGWQFCSPPQGVEVEKAAVVASQPNTDVLLERKRGRPRKAE